MLLNFVRSSVIGRVVHVAVGAVVRAVVVVVAVSTSVATVVATIAPSRQGFWVREGLRVKIREGFWQGLHHHQRRQDHGHPQQKG